MLTSSADYFQRNNIYCGNLADFCSGMEKLPPTPNSIPWRTAVTSHDPGEANVMASQYCRLGDVLIYG
jgi:hypothetical protein